MYLNNCLAAKSILYLIKKTRLFIYLATCILLSSCADTPEPTLRLGTNIWPGYEPLYLARKRGSLANEKVHLVEFSSASQTIQAYRNNLIDAAALTLDEVLMLKDSGEHLKIVLIMDISNGGDAILGQKNIKTLAEIKGKRIGVENGALGGYIFSRALEIVKLDSQSVDIIAIDINEHEKYFLEHKIDAVVTFEPVRSKLIEAGANLLFDSRQLPGEIVDVLIIRDEFINKYPDRINYLLDAWFKTLTYMQSKPLEAAQILGLRMKLTATETLYSYTMLTLPNKKENNNLLKNEPAPLLLSTINKLSSFMLNNNLIKKNINSHSLFQPLNDTHHENK